MENKKRIIVIAVVVVLVMLITILTIMLIKIEKNKGKEVFNSNENVIENNTIENDIENEFVENTNIVDTEKEENNKNNSQNTSPSIGEEEVTKTEIEKEKSNKEKAMEIVKKDWGEDDNVYFSSDDLASTNEEYVIHVRESKTTWEICTYTVNVKKGTFTKEQ